MTYTIGILGCGDFLRWQSDSLKNSPSITVGALFDPDKARAESFAADLGGKAVDNADAIFNDPAIDIVMLFVPPWIRPALFEQGCTAGKHMILTKPLAPSIAECERMQAAADAAGIKCAVIYSRTGDNWVESCKTLLESGDKGRLALYRQDWIHAYPQWNNWATDPEKNGGPFMDAMIHNLNAANYLMGRPMAKACMFSDRLSHPDMACADTESVVAHYEDGGMAHLFITWAADLAVYSKNGNDRDHIDHFYLVTDQGWHVTQDRVDGKSVIRATKDSVVENIPVTPMADSHYEAFAQCIANNTAIPRCLAPIEAAAADITLLRTLEKEPGVTMQVPAPATV